jgi:hypothetical protein
MLYHEDEGYYSGLIGYVKPFSNALYGNFKLVEALASGNNSPLDINYQSRSLWDAAQTEAYGRAILLTFESYLEGDNWGTHSYALYRAFHNIQGVCSDVYKLDGVEVGFYSTDIYQRLSEVVGFIKHAIDLLEKYKEGPSARSGDIVGMNANERRGRHRQRAEKKRGEPLMFGGS